MVTGAAHESAPLRLAAFSTIAPVPGVMSTKASRFPAAEVVA